jgi:aryl-alcohol dehydrogenase-like predicted oxidoreductase
MKKIKIAGTDLEITPLAFGAWAIGGWFWGGAEEKESLTAIEKSLDLGMTTIDTAPVYGFGQSEELVAKVIRNKRTSVEILTKFGLRWDVAEGNFYFNTLDNQGKPMTVHKLGSKESVMKECENSLRRLKTDYIDLYQQHWPDTSTPIEETMEALDRLQEKGKIRAGGVCNYSLDQMKEALKYYPVASDQVPYSMVLRAIEKDLVPWSIGNRKAIIAYSPLQRGILTGKITSGYKFGEGDHRPNTPFYKEPNLTRINKFLSLIKPAADSKKVTLAQLVLKWTLMQPGITCVLAGARSASQVEENFAADSIEIAPAEMDFINNSLNALKLQL